MLQELRNNPKVNSNFYKNGDSRNYLNCEITNESINTHRTNEKVSQNSQCKYLKDFSVKHRENETINNSKKGSYSKNQKSQQRKVTMKREKEYMDLYKFKEKLGAVFPGSNNLSSILISNKSNSNLLNKTLTLKNAESNKYVYNIESDDAKNLIPETGGIDAIKKEGVYNSSHQRNYTMNPMYSNAYPDYSNNQYLFVSHDEPSFNPDHFCSFKSSAQRKCSNQKQSFLNPKSKSKKRSRNKNVICSGLNSSRNKFGNKLLKTTKQECKFR